MKSICAVVMATMLAGCTAMPRYQTIGGIRIQMVHEFIRESLSAYHIPKEDLVDTMAALANQREFQLLYLPQKQLAVNITVDSTVNSSTSRVDILHTLLAQGLEVELIHNHNNQDLDPNRESVGNAFYWIAPSLQDLGQYLAIGEQGLKFRYRIASQYGLLTMSTSEETFNFSGNIYFYQALVSAAEHVQMTLKGKTAGDLPTWATDYRGMFALSFEQTTP
jgi:hypothetical protein